MHKALSIPISVTVFGFIFISIAFAVMVSCVRYYFGDLDISLIISHLQLVHTVDFSYYLAQIVGGSFVTLILSLMIYRWKKIGIPLLLLALGWTFDLHKIHWFDTPEMPYHRYYTIPKVIPPTNPKNIILINLESVEKLWIYPDITGNESVLSHLTQLQSEGTYVQGWRYINGMDPTFPAYIAENCGIPRSEGLKNASKIFFKDQVGAYPRAVCVNDILYKNGYHTVFLAGNLLMNEGGARFTAAHPYTTVMAKEHLIEQGYTTNSEHITGYNAIPDRVLFNYAKEKLEKLGQTRTPFFMSIITVNTHGPAYNHIEPGCERKYNDIRDSMKCMDQKVVEFVRWVQAQHFYKDTVIFLIGDHPTWRLALQHMRWLDFKKVKAHDPAETYNVVLDGSTNEVRVINKPFTQVDWAPTMLESAGFTLKPRRLGLGVSLWSNEPGLLEKYGSAKKLEDALKNSTDAHYYFLYEGKH